MTLAGTLAGIADVCGAGDGAALVRTLSGMALRDSQAHQRLCDAMPTAAGRTLAARLDAAWHDMPSVTGSALALALETAMATRQRTLALSSATLVVTGPAVDGVPVRLTRAVALELIAEATREVILSTFSAGRVDDLVAGLRAAHGRGAVVRLILETHAGSDGFLVRDAREAFAALNGQAEIYHWPIEKRAAPLPFGVGSAGFSPRALLHAKTLVVDASAAFITSANVSETAMEHSIEAGVIVRGGDVPRQLAEYWRGLIAQGMLARD